MKYHHPAIVASTLMLGWGLVAWADSATFEPPAATNCDTRPPVVEQKLDPHPGGADDTGSQYAAPVGDQTGTGTETAADKMKPDQKVVPGSEETAGSR